MIVCKTFHARGVLLSYQYIFGNSVDLNIIPIVDERNITNDDWYLEQSNVDIVMGEVEKIWKYFKTMITV